MRPDKTDPGTNQMTAPPVTARTEAGADAPALQRRERAGSPSPEAMAGDTSWQDIKSRFVDDPAGALAAAEELVRQAAEQRIRAVKDEVAALCARGRDDESRNTEDLRTRLLRYQEYCSR